MEEDEGKVGRRRKTRAAAVAARAISAGRSVQLLTRASPLTSSSSSSCLHPALSSVLLQHAFHVRAYNPLISAVSDETHTSPGVEDSSSYLLPWLSRHQDRRHNCLALCRESSLMWVVGILPRTHICGDSAPQQGRWRVRSCRSPHRCRRLPRAAQPLHLLRGRLSCSRMGPEVHPSCKCMAGYLL